MEGTLETTAGFVCPTCAKNYKTRRYYEKHLQTHGDAGGSAAAGATGAIPVAQQTSAVIFPCKACKKTFKTAKGLQKHELNTHPAPGPSQSAVNNNSVSENPTIHDSQDDNDLWPEDAVLLDAYHNVDEIVSFFEEDDEEQERLLLAAEIGVEPANPGEPSNIKDLTEKKQPTGKKPKKAPFVKCTVCGSSLQTLDGFVKHKMGHATSDAIARAPSLDVVCAASSSLVKEVASDMFNENLLASTTLECNLQENSCKMKELFDTPEMQDFVRTLIECFYAVFTSGTKFLLPSQLRSVYLRNVCHLLVNQEKKQNLRSKLLSALQISNCEYDIIFFMVTFIRKMSHKVLAFIIRFIIHDGDGTYKHSEYAVTSQSVESNDFKQLIHYIGGANVKSVLRCAWRSWGQSDECKMVINILRSNFLVNNPEDIGAPDPNFMEWTLSQDRGKLLKINDKALGFFCELASIVKPLEHFDGSLLVEEVIEKFPDHPKILFLWDLLIQETLPSKVSFKLLHSLCENFCNTWRSGVVRRRLDQLQSASKGDPQGTRGVAFRPKVVKFSAASS